MSLTIKDIANKAGFSPATVSMVLNNKAGISQATRDKVLRIVEEYGYSSSALKNDLTKSKGNIQLLVYKKHSKILKDTPFFQSLIEGIESKARHNGYQLAIKYISGEKPDIDVLTKDLGQTIVDGIIILGTEMEKLDLIEFLKVDLPILVLDSYFLDIPTNYVVINNESGSYMATKYLLDHGHTQIGYLKSSIHIRNFTERFEGYCKAMIDNGYHPDPNHTFLLSPSMENAYEDMKMYLKKNPELPTAFFADNDLIAIGAMKALKEKDIKIPEDVSIVGFDDLSFSAMTDPPLSTIGVEKKILGKIAVENLIDIIEKKNQYFTKMMLDVTLVERASVKLL